MEFVIISKLLHTLCSKLRIENKNIKILSENIEDILIDIVEIEIEDTNKLYFEKK